MLTEIWLTCAHHVFDSLKVADGRPANSRDTISVRHLGLPLIFGGRFRMRQTLTGYE
jgi:hypothetical protein